MRNGTYSSSLHIPLTNYHLLASKQEPHKKPTFWQEILKNFLEASPVNWPLMKTDKTKRATALVEEQDRRQKRGIKGQVWDSRHPQPPFRVVLDPG